MDFIFVEVHRESQIRGKNERKKVTFTFDCVSCESKKCHSIKFKFYLVLARCLDGFGSDLTVNVNHQEEIDEDEREFIISNIDNLLDLLQKWRNVYQQ